MPHFNTTELSLIDLTIRMGVVPRLEVNHLMLEAHLKHIETLKQSHLDNVGLDRSELMSNNKFALLLEAHGIEAPLKLSATTGKMTYAFAKTDDGFKALLEHTNAEVAALASARLGVKSTLEETRTKRFMSIAGRIGALRTIPDEGYGTLPIPLNYYGAATGRWSAGSGQKVNFQNLPRGSVIKEAIIAPEGYVIVGADLSNIELRVGMWVAGETEALKLLGEGGDLYKDFASKVFSVPYDEVTKDQRFIGKTSQLSLIFGVGAAKLRAAVKAGSGEDLPNAKEIVDLYRDTYTGVTKFWSKCTKAITNMAAPDSKVELKEFYFGPNDIFKAALDDKGVSRGVRLPSGLFMKYPELHKYTEEEGWSEAYQYKLRNGYDKLYGGKMFNNLVQGTARCIMGEIMVRVSKRYNIVLTVHDSIYILAPEAEAEEALEFLIREMTTPPAWLQGCPLAAEGGYGKSLKEAG
jgi:DNA polymerase